MTGTLVKVLSWERVLTDYYSDNYIEFMVEGISRFKILDVLTER